MLPPSSTNTLPRLQGSCIQFRGAATKSSKQWVARQTRDPFVRQRNVDGASFRSRSAFKLLELEERFKFLGRAKTLIDLGAAPGGWSQVAARAIHRGPSSLEGEIDSRSGKVIAVDLLPLTAIPGVTIIQGDFLAEQTQARILELIRPATSVDVVLSDMAPNMSGNRLRDVDLSLELCTAAFEFASGLLSEATPTDKHRGVLAMKYFDHPELQAFKKEQLQPAFWHVTNVKPQSSRSESSEAYWVCHGFRIST